MATKIAKKPVAAKKKTTKKKTVINYAAHRAKMAAKFSEASAAGRDIGKIPPVRGKKRREKCRLSLRQFCETYLRATFCLGWSDDHLEVLSTLEDVVLRGGKFCIAMARGSGKSSMTIAAGVWAILYGHRRFAVVVNATADESVKVIESIRSIIEQNELIRADFPEACFPIEQLGGINQRAPGQLYHGRRTNITWTGRELVFPTVENSVCSGAATYSVGITGAVRGLSLLTPDGSTQRPDIVLINDPSTDESARSLAENNRRERSIGGALAKLGGPDQSIAMVCTCTIIQQGDLASRLLDPKRHPEWRGRIYALMRSMPAKMEYWQKYKEIRAESLIEWGDIREATAYYRSNRQEMDRGAVASWALRKEAHHLSAIQYGMDQWAEDEETFWSEFQNAPINRSLADVETLDSEAVAERYNGIPRDIVPDWAEIVTAGVDVQQDSLWWVIAAWDRSMRGHIVDYGVYPEQSQNYTTNNDIRRTLMTAFDLDTVEDALACGLDALADLLLGQQYPTQSGASVQMSHLAIDANWNRSTDLVYQLARTKYQGKIIPMHGRYVGATGSTVDQWRGEKGDKRGPGWIMQLGRRQQRHAIVDTNQLKSWLSGQLTAESGISLPGDNSAALAMLADNLTAEYGTEVSAKTGRKCTEWKCRPGRDNHFLDALIMSAVAASIGGAQLPGQPDAKPKRRRVNPSEIQRKNREQRSRNGLS